MTACAVEIGLAHYLRDQEAQEIANGYRANAATTGEGSVAASLGVGTKAKAGIGGAIVLLGCDESSGELLRVFASMVGEHGINPDVWYSLDSYGMPVEVSE